ncbi:MAG: DNA-directed RNA polymerase [Candidatus Woesearchaeota archaeon]|nr:DNA-directed RNA polymerase [Candidatus Woesearchaeota archaeon]
MFYKLLVKDHIRVSPENFDKELKDSIAKEVRVKYTGYISKELGIVIDVIDVKDVGDGVIIPGDGAPYYESQFELLVFEPEMQEVLPGKIKDIADFGAFLTMGPIDGMVHISQTMNDYVSYSKEKVLNGRDTSRVLKMGDKCVAKIVAISYKDPTNPKFGLTMRTEGLGKEEWVTGDLENA